MSSSALPGLDLAPSIADALIIESRRYVLGSQLAQGGMAALYHGQRIARGGFVKRVVLKRLRPELADNRAAEALFIREACLGADLEHPNIVRVYDLTEIEGVTYLVMEYVHGGDLRLVMRRLRRRGRRFAAAAALYVGRELCAALDYAHGRIREDGGPLGLIHRDVSPTNILLSVNGEIKLTDFGIAQTEGTDAECLLPRARGQIGYMSPEQAAGTEQDGRSDLFSLATVLYEVCTGQRLFVGEVGQSSLEVYQTAVIPPSRIDRTLPPELDHLLLSGLALSVSDRPLSARAFLQELLAVTERCNLWMDRWSFADHLQEICGPNPDDWSTLEERTNTAIIASDLAELDDVLLRTGPAELERARPDELGGLDTPALPDAGGECRYEPSESLITVPWPVMTGGELPPALLTERYARQEALFGEDTLPLPLAKLSGPRKVPFQTGLFRVPPVGRRLLSRDSLLGVAVGLLLSALVWLLFMAAL